MCLQTLRRHVCRHCRAEWNHSDALELCPEGDKAVLKHGYCAPVSQILESGGHHVSRACVPDHHQHQQLHHHHHNHHHHHPQTAAVPVGGGPAHIYPGHHGAPTAAASASSSGNGLGAPDAPAPIEDMCDDCKEKHFREWLVEAKLRQEQQQQQRLLQQQQAQQALQQAEQAQHQLNGV